MAREWFAHYDRHFDIKPDDSGLEEARFIKRVLRLRRGQSALDVPCGAGRVAIHLARRGIRMTGVDATQAYIDRARRRFAQERLAGTFHVRDMRRIDFDAKFDAAFNWQGSFGFFGDAQDLDFLQRLARAIRPGGRVLVDQRSREHMLRHFRAKHVEGYVTSRTTWNRRTQQAITVQTDRRTGRSWRMTIRFYTPAQFRELFAAAGLDVEAMYGDLAGNEYMRGSRRICVLGRKPR